MRNQWLMGKIGLWWGVIAAVAFPATDLQAAAAQMKASRPNIVLILADDMGYSDLGCFGSEIATPNLDRMATEGLRMSQFYTTPRCCPTRAALLTGLYPQQAGIGDMMEDRGIPGYRGEINANCPTIAESLKQADYRTLMVGKWHTSHIRFNGKAQLNYESDEPFWDNKNSWPLQRGFDEYYGTIHGVNSYYDPFSLTRGNTPTKHETKDFYYTDVLSREAAASIDKHAGGEKPFFLYVAYTAPHWPLQAPEADIAKYRERYMAGWDVIRSNRYERQIELGLIDKSWPLSPRDARVPGWGQVKDKEWEANRMATYAAMVEHVDRGVGRILERLKAKGVDQNTLVIFFSDNGACAEVIEPGWYDVPSKTRSGQVVKVGNRNHSVMAGPEDVWQSYGVPWANVSDTPFVRYKHFTHEGGIAAPFIAYWPSKIKKPGTISRQIGHVTDIMPTFMELAGTSRQPTFKGQPAPTLEGQSLVQIFEDETRAHPTPIFWEHEGNRAVRIGKWKLVAVNRQDWELYDVETDRTEQNDLASKEPERVKEMSALYEAWAKRCLVLPPEQLPRPKPIVPAEKETTSKGASVAASKP